MQTDDTSREQYAADMETHGCVLAATDDAFRLYLERSKSRTFLHTIPLADMDEAVAGRLRAALTRVAAEHGDIHAAEHDPAEDAQRAAASFWIFLGFRPSGKLMGHDGHPREVFMLTGETL